MDSLIGAMLGLLVGVAQLHEADDNLGRARRVLTVMSRRAMTNKLILVAICVLLMASIGVVIYFKLKN
jgi:hypothetical protein